MLQVKTVRDPHKNGTSSVPNAFYEILEHMAEDGSEYNWSSYP